jgi:hypothetical protein
MPQKPKRLMSGTKTHKKKPVAFWHGVMSAGLILAVILMMVCAGCRREKTGKLVAIKASIGLDESIKGKAEHMEYLGTVVVELSDGSKVDAICDDKEIFSQLRGGQKLGIKPIANNKWRVVRVIE